MIDHTAVIAVVQIQTNPRDKADIFAVTYSQHTGTRLQSFMFIWQSNVPVMSYSTQIKEIIEADSYEQILQNVRDGDWAATEDLEGTFRRFAEELCTDTKEVLGNHLRKKSSTTMTQIFYYFIFRRFQEVFGRYL